MKFNRRLARRPISKEYLPRLYGIYYFSTYCRYQFTSMATSTPMTSQPSLDAVSAPDPRAHVLLVDDHLLLIDLLDAYLGRLIPAMRISKATSMPQALAVAQQHADIQLAVLDLRMPDMDGLTGLRHLRSLRPGLPIAIMTGSPEASGAREARKLGAVGFILKTIGAPAICEALLTILSGKLYFPESPSIHSDGVPAASSVADLTARELQVVYELAGGCSNKEIAQALGIAPVTVSLHLSNIYRKLGSANRTQAMRRCYELGVIPERRDR